MHVSSCSSTMINTDIEILRKRIDEIALSSIKKKSCPHPGFIKNLCMSCSQKIDANDDIKSSYNSATSFAYINKDLKLTTHEITRLKDINTEKLLKRRKLYLVLDLDHTLIHAISPKDMKADEKYLLKNGHLCNVSCVNMMVKLRLYVKEFLEQASSMFDMYVYTMGDRIYVNGMVKILDPDGVYFGPRIVSREDNTRGYLKGLDVILGRDSAVVIVDDTEEVWKDHMENLIRIEGYFYFAKGLQKEGHSGKSLAQMKRSGENEGDGELGRVVEELTKIHEKFFQGHDQAKILKRDVKEVMKKVLNEEEAFSE